MRYCGSKRKFMKELLPILMKNTNEDILFVDVFGGGMNVVSEIPLKRKIANDNNPYVIELWKTLQNYKVKGTSLPNMINNHVTEDEYNDVKVSFLDKTSKYSYSEIGYIGAALSYGGAFFNGYAKFNPKKNEDHVKEAYNGLMKQLDNFKYIEQTKFICKDYRDIVIEDNIIPSNVILFCDPPYFSTRKYLSDFDTKAFWDWAREQSLKGYRVYVCEYDAPSDFKCVWHKKKKDGMATTKTGKKQKTKIEKMFVYNR